MAGNAAIDLTVVGDKDANGIEEAGALMLRDADGRILVQGRNASRTPLPKDYWFAP